jgi:lipid A disaccharide synthetase
VAITTIEEAITTTTVEVVTTTTEEAEMVEEETPDNQNASFAPIITSGEEQTVMLGAKHVTLVENPTVSLEARYAAEPQHKQCATSTKKDEWTKEMWTIYSFLK